MNTIKAILLTTAILLLSGCGMYDRQTIKFECNNKGDIVVYLYKAKMVSMDENITQPKFLVRERILDITDFEVICKRTNDEKH